MTEMKLTIWAKSNGSINNGKIMEISGTRGFTHNSIERRLNSNGTRSSVSFDIYPYWRNGNICIYNVSKSTMDTANKIIIHMSVDYIQETITVTPDLAMFNGSYTLTLEGAHGCKYFETTITGTAT